MEKLVYRRYDVVLSDVRMPDLDGPALFELLEQRYPDLLPRLAFVTGDTMSPGIRRFLESCGRPYLEKPVVPADLRRLVARLGAQVRREDERCATASMSGWWATGGEGMRGGWGKRGSVGVE